MNSTQTLIVVKLHKLWEDAVAETNRIMADKNFDPEIANRAMIRQEAFAEAKDEAQKALIING